MTPATPLSGVGIWEWDSAADYHAASASGIAWIAIRATNADGAGKAAAFESAFRERSLAASSAGLAVLGWTQWYGPHDGLVRGDVATYLRGCAAYTAGLPLQLSGWIVDAEDRDLPGLGEALRQLRSLSGQPVYLCAPGDPTTYGLTWDWAPINASVDALMPMVYTAMWRRDPTAPGGGDVAFAFRAAMGELDAVTRDVPRLPVGDETDPDRISAWVQEARAAKMPAISFFRMGVARDSEAAIVYGASFTTAPSPPPPSQPLTAPPATRATNVHQPTGWAQLTTPGPDGVEQGIFTSEFLATQVTTLLIAIFGALTSFGVIGLSDDQKKTVIQLVVAVIGLLQVAYTVGRSVRKGMASVGHSTTGPVDGKQVTPTQ